MKYNQLLKSYIVISFVFIAACSPKVENRGFVKQQPWKESIVVGKTSKQEVLEKFGSPSSKSSFGEETWYYISDRKESVAFFRPEIVEQEAAYINFDASGMVKEVNVYDKNNAKDFAIATRTTPTEGHSMGFIDQVMGNIGRFNKPGGTEGVSTGGRRPAGRGGF